MCSLQAQAKITPDDIITGYFLRTTKNIIKSLNETLKCEADLVLKIRITTLSAACYLEVVVRDLCEAMVMSMDVPCHLVLTSSLWYRCERSTKLTLLFITACPQPKGVCVYIFLSVCVRVCVSVW